MHAPYQNPQVGQILVAVPQKLNDNIESFLISYHEHMRYAGSPYDFNADALKVESICRQHYAIRVDKSDAIV
jgi:hypothetical protein